MTNHSPAHAVFDEPAALLARKQVSADTFELVLRSPRIAAAARPGQFVSVLLPSPDFAYRVLEGEEVWAAAPRAAQPFLIRRPYSVYRAFSSNGSDEPDAISLLVKVVGAGSRCLAELPVGAVVQVLGPLGSSFRLPPVGAAAALVAGGCGWASLAMLAGELRRMHHPTYAFIGAQTVEALPLETTEASTGAASFLDELPDVCLTSSELEALGITVALAAEAGGKVYGGLVTDLLDAFLRKREIGSVSVYACGPRAMLAHVANLARAHDALCQVAMEERMACGMGVCNSCVVEVRLPDGSTGHKKLCVDGPVLDAEEVVWETQ